MTSEKVLAVLDRYEISIGLHANAVDVDPAKQFEHLLSMIPRMRVFVSEGRMDKVFRWLGFMQGVLWTLEVYTLDELKEHNSPDAPLPHTAP